MYENFRSTNPNCVYISFEDIQEERRQKRTNKDGGKQYLRAVLQYDIKNALLEKDLPCLTTLMVHFEYAT